MEHSPTFVIAFWLITFMTLVAGAMATMAKNVVTAAYALFFALLGLSGYFILLGSDFMAVVQVVVYVGGILTLLLFGVLLTNRTYRHVSGEQETASRLPALLLAVFVMGILFTAVALGGFYPSAPIEHGDLGAYAPKTSELGVYLLSRHVVAFELSGLTLLGALLGAAYLVRKRED